MNGDRFDIKVEFIAQKGELEEPNCFTLLFDNKPLAEDFVVNVKVSNEYVD